MDLEPDDDLPNLEGPPPLAPKCNSYKWGVEVIDAAGNIEGKMVTSKEVWKSQNSRVIMHFDEESGQPIGDSAGLFGSWLGQLSSDVQLLPINYTDWRRVNPHHKQKAWEMILNKFWFDAPAMRKAYVMSALGDRCKGFKGRLWKDYKRATLTETMQNRPKDVPECQWNHLVHMRFTEKWMNMQKQNTESQKYNTSPHGCGRMSFPRKRNDIKIKTGKTPSRAEFFICTRKKSDGSFVSEEAKTHAEKLEALLTQNPRVTSNAIASLDDEFAEVFGPERHGRVRCVGRGVTPSKIARRSTASVPVENSEMVMQLRAEVAAYKKRDKTMSAFISHMLATSSSASSSEQANFAAALGNIPNPTSTDMPIPIPTNPAESPTNPEEMDNNVIGDPSG